jgi:hypothetical protein
LKGIADVAPDLNGKNHLDSHQNHRQNFQPAHSLILLILAKPLCFPSGLFQSKRSR